MSRPGTGLQGLQAIGSKPPSRAGTAGPERFSGTPPPGTAGSNAGRLTAPRSVSKSISHAILIAVAHLLVRGAVQGARTGSALNVVQDKATQMLIVKMRARFGVSATTHDLHAGTMCLRNSTPMECMLACRKVMCLPLGCIAHVHSASSILQRQPR
jgi:hypothetical protein